MKAIKENWKLVLIVASGIVAVIFMFIFVVLFIAPPKIKLQVAWLIDLHTAMPEAFSSYCLKYIQL